MKYLETFLILGALIIVILGITKTHKKIGKENFEVATVDEVKSGSSTFYDWGEMPSSKKCSKKKKEKEKEKDCYASEPLCESCTSGDNVVYDYDYHIYNNGDKQTKTKNGCSHCDITKHPDIDKYVLKTSIPPMPDMAKFATKSMIPPNIDMRDYVKKSAIKSCPKCPDMRDYVLKSTIPANVECPICPICSISPPCQKYDKIEDDPRFNEVYQRKFKESIRRHFTKNSDCKGAYEKGYQDALSNKNRRDISNTDVNSNNSNNSSANPNINPLQTEFTRNDTNYDLYKGFASNKC
jgi:hypothetical protein